MIIGAANLLIMLLILPVFNYDSGIKVYPKYEDALQLAIDLGRLDAISILLTVFGILLAILALVGFGYIENRAIAMAKETASAYSIEYYKQQEARLSEVLKRFNETPQQFSATEIKPTEVDITRIVPERGSDGNA